MGKEVRVAQLPNCDTHRYNPLFEDDADAEAIAKARHNSYLKAPFNTWGNTCDPCFELFGVDSSIAEVLVPA